MLLFAYAQEILFNLFFEFDFIATVFDMIIRDQSLYLVVIYLHLLKIQRPYGSGGNRISSNEIKIYLDFSSPSGE